MMPLPPFSTGPEEAADGFSGAIHATSVMIDDRVVLIRGESGAGKSDLALRLIDRGATLVSDDYTRVSASEDRVMASTPANIAGKIEVRGVGILAFPHVEQGPVALVVDLGASGEPAPDRYPLAPQTTRLCGMGLPVLRLDAHEASAPLKVELALRESARAPAGGGVAR